MLVSCKMAQVVQFNLRGAPVLLSTSLSTKLKSQTVSHYCFLRKTNSQKQTNSLYRTGKPHTHIYSNSWQWSLPSRLTYWRGRWRCWLVEGQELGMRYHISWENMEPSLLSWAAAGMSLTLLLTPLDLMEFM